MTGGGIQLGASRFHPAGTRPVSLRVCSTPGCPTLVPKQGRCPQHQAQHERARGTRQQRGYDTTHQRLRKQWEPRVNTGTVACWRCGQLIHPTEPWDMGHDDLDRRMYRGPEHAACNRATTGRAPNTTR